MELAAPPPGAEVVMRRLAWSDAQPKLEASRPWPLEEVLARVVLLRQSNKPLQRTGPAPAFVYRRFGEPAPQLNVMYVGQTCLGESLDIGFDSSHRNPGFRIGLSCGLHLRQCRVAGTASSGRTSAGHRASESVRRAGLQVSPGRLRGSSVRLGSKRQGPGHRGVLRARAR